MASIPKTCPSCANASVRRVAYGFPSPEARAASDRDEIILGGCLVDDSFPTWQCLRCGHSDKPWPSGDEVHGEA